MWGQSLGGEDPREKEMATHSGIHVLYFVTLPVPFFTMQSLSFNMRPINVAIYTVVIPPIALSLQNRTISRENETNCSLCSVNSLQ